VLQKDADRLVLRFANQTGIDVSAADVGEAADVAQDLAEEIGPLPGDRERANAPRANAADSSPGGVLPKIVILAHFRQNLFFQKPDVLIGERVVFEATVAARL